MADVWTRDLPHDEQAVMLAMADHAHDDGSRCFPSVARIAWKTGYQERSVRRTMAELRKRGVLELVTPGGGRGRSSRYQIHVDRIPKKPPLNPDRCDTNPDAQDRVSAPLNPDGCDTNPDRCDTNPDPPDRGTIKEPPEEEEASATEFVAASETTLAVVNLCQRLGTPWSLKSRTAAQWSAELDAGERYAHLKLAPLISDCSDYWEGRETKRKQPHRFIKAWLDNHIKFARAAAQEMAPQPINKTASHRL